MGIRTLTTETERIERTEQNEPNVWLNFIKYSVNETKAKDKIFIFKTHDDLFPLVLRLLVKLTSAIHP